jgi:flagellar hook protein FlgE
VRYSISAQGTFTYTTSSTDLAINGKGFFIVEGSDGLEYMTRAGAFTVTDDGSLRNSAGYDLLGYEYSSTEDPTIVINGFDGLQKINLSSGSLNAEGSTGGALDVNLPSNEPIGYEKSTSLVAYDSQGNRRLIEFNYVKTGDNEWTVEATHDGAVVAASTTLTFDSKGQLLTPSPATITTTAVTLEGANLEALAITIGGSTQLASAFDVSNGKINGNGASKVTDYDISADGIVSLKYDDGKLVPKFRIAMASVQSPDNLKPLPGNLYAQSNDSGVVVMGYAGTNGYGSILSGALEDSNVDIAEELTSMIESQRNYTANSKVFQTGSELMEVLVNLKR